ncbi:MULTISPECIES: chemotaxis protein CheW [unclassified Leptolyngbya]|uniref:chemotaxis protein CheW n=1 Tax=unclassified Leptolyngbya TaxID=2650499 RepID=UPI001687B251|nr:MULTISPECIES: chemotaxis protein CheW [unclassified Leptolyngbya]MBD1913812.1 chemotaxis protein CheW [Leptolyngbya sp. FACHB-8]MBD2156549.1 chemotaxis protein CheW [Leptolyngbya sp. FACHB-16]
MAIQQICTFFLNNTRFGIGVEHVQEIIRQQPLTQVPLAAPDVCGLMNLRGQVIPVVDLPCRLGLRSAPCGSEKETVYNIIVSAEDDVVSFIVDDIGDILECSTETLEPPPATLDTYIRSSLTGAYKLEHDFLLLLNTQKILDPALTRRS